MNSSSVEPVKPRRIASELAAMESVLRNEATYQQAVSLSAKLRSTISLIKYFPTNDWRTFNSHLLRPFTNEKHLTRNAVAGIPVHVKEAINNLAIKVLAANKEGVNSSLLATPEIILVRNAHKVVNSPEFSRQLSYAIIDSPGAVALVVAFVKLEKRKILTVQPKLKDLCRQLFKARIDFDPRQV